MTTLKTQSPSGEAFIASLVNYVERKRPDLLSGTVTLKLPPRALEYIAGRLQTLQQLQNLKATNTVDYLRWFVSDLQDYKRLEKLQRVLESLTSVHVGSANPGLRDPTAVNLTPLKSLTSLTLRGCDLSTAAWSGSESVRPSLRVLKCYNSLEELQHLLSPNTRSSRAEGVHGAPRWPRLTRLTCAHNSFTAMDASLTLLPALQDLELPCNNIAALDNLHNARALTSLNLAFNSIASVALLPQCPGAIRRLNLQGNMISSTNGLDELVALEVLDLRSNLVASLQEVRQLADLPNLREVWLEGNPLGHAPHYRLRVLACFGANSDLVLDGRRTSRAELARVADASAGKLQEEEQEEEVLLQYVEQDVHLFRASDEGGPGDGWRERRRRQGLPGQSRTARRVIDFLPNRPPALTPSPSHDDEAGAGPSRSARETSEADMPAAAPPTPTWLRELRLARSPMHDDRARDGRFATPPTWPPEPGWQPGSGWAAEPPPGSGQNGSRQATPRSSSPPRYEDAVLERLRQVSPLPYGDNAELVGVRPADVATDWEWGTESDSDSSSSSPFESPRSTQAVPAMPSGWEDRSKADEAANGQGGSSSRTQADSVVKRLGSLGLS